MVRLAEVEDAAAVLVEKAQEQAQRMRESAEAAGETLVKEAEGSVVEAQEQAWHEACARIDAQRREACGQLECELSVLEEDVERFEAFLDGFFFG